MWNEGPKSLYQHLPQRCFPKLFTREKSQSQFNTSQIVANLGFTWTTLEDLLHSRVMTRTTCLLVSVKDLHWIISSKLMLKKYLQCLTQGTLTQRPLRNRFWTLASASNSYTRYQTRQGFLPGDTLNTKTTQTSWWIQTKRLSQDAIDQEKDPFRNPGPRPRRKLLFHEQGYLCFDSNHDKIQKNDLKMGSRACPCRANMHKNALVCLLQFCLQRLPTAKVSSWEDGPHGPWAAQEMLQFALSESYQTKVPRNPLAALNAKRLNRSHTQSSCYQQSCLGKCQWMCFTYHQPVIWHYSSWSHLHSLDMQRLSHVTICAMHVPLAFLFWISAGNSTWHSRTTTHSPFNLFPQQRRRLFLLNLGTGQRFRLRQTSGSGSIKHFDSLRESLPSSTV